MVKIIPAILTNSPEEARELISKAEGLVDRVQIDIIDGEFANNKTIFPEAMESVDTNLLFDYHLMVKNPVNWIEKCVRGQADRVIGQIELMSDQKEFIEKATSLGLKVGLGIDIDTPVTSIDESLFSDIDVLLLMSVKAGFAGQQFELRVWDKIKEIMIIKQKHDARFNLCVDGGITKELYNDMAKTHVNEVAVGKRIFEDSLKENLELFNEAYG